MPRVLHLARRPLNGHPCWIAEMQRRAGWESKVCLLVNRETGQRPYPSDFRAVDRTALRDWLAGCNILHLHGDMTLNDPLARDAYDLLWEGGIVVQQYYHDLREIAHPLRRMATEPDEFACVVAKKVATLFPMFQALPVVIPLWRPELKPVIRKRERLRIAFTPTTTQRYPGYGSTFGKGYQETQPILARLARYVDVDIITDKSWRETMLACQDADIRLDELVTGGYGQATLEGLAHGSIVINGLSDDVQRVFPATFPGFRTTVDRLSDVVQRILDMRWDDRQAMMQAGPDWVLANCQENTWHASYERFYRNCFARMGDVGQIDAKPLEATRNTVGVIGFKDVETAIPQQRVQSKEGGKLIVQIAKTNCAGAIWRIHEAIERYTNHRCRTITFSDTTNGRKYRSDILFHDTAEVQRTLEQADVIHFHNWIDHRSAEMQPFRQFLRGKRIVLQYHTEPRLLQPAFPQSNVIDRDDITTLVIAQKHARFYPRSVLVPNLIDIDDKLLTPSERAWTGGPLKLIYTPSDLKSYGSYKDTCCGKGYQETMPVLQKLEKDGIVESKIITDMRWEDLMPIKRQHDVCIDELVTGGYHLCTLEALSQGLATIGWIDRKTREAIGSVAGDENMPVLQAPIIPGSSESFEERSGPEVLDATIRSMHREGPDYVRKLKERSRSWMVSNWHPARMIKHYLKAYGIADDKHVVRYFTQQNYLLPVYRVPERIDDNLRQLEGAWKDSRVVIWGNGPTALDALANPCWGFGAKHIGTNAAAKLGITFDAYCVSDTRFVRDPAKREIAVSAPGIKVYQSVVRPYLPEEMSVNYVRTIGSEGFSSNLLRGVFHGYSVVWLALQVAAWAGARDVLLAGCGHSYDPLRPRFYKEDRPAQVDNSWPRIASNYQRFASIASELGIRLRTIGPSRLNEVGIPSM